MVFNFRLFFQFMSSSISRKKPFYPINPQLRRFLKHYSREAKIGVQYHELLRFENAIPLYDRSGKDTLWQTVLYSQNDSISLGKTLVEIYTLLRTGGELIDHLYVDRIDYCIFGNSKPFRIRIVNSFNDNFDYFYIKFADASRIYGLELEHILSPNRISYIVDKDTLVEEHIAGIPGDMFIKNHLHDKDVNEIRLAKEFVKFNERCFIRLLGDMRAYNYVIAVTPDFEDVHYRIRAIDFDQQSYEGKMRLYLPQFFKENNKIVELCIKHINNESVHQYQLEEQTLVARRIKATRYMTRDLLDAMMRDPLSEPEKIFSLKHELAEHYQNNAFLKGRSMGELVKISLKEMIRKNRTHFKKLATMYR